MPRYRLTVRRIVLVVAVVALGFGSNQAYRRREVFLKLAESHFRESRGARSAHNDCVTWNFGEPAHGVIAIGHLPPPDISRGAAAYYAELAEYHAELGRKYAHAASYPWGVVEPDRLMPHDPRKSGFDQTRLLARRLAEQIDRGTCACYATDADLTYNAAFVVLAFEQILGRSPSVEERAEYENLLDEWTERLKAGLTVGMFAAGALSPVAPAIEPAQRAREYIVYVLYNSNDFVPIR